MKSNILFAVVFLCVVAMMAGCLWLPDGMRWAVYAAGFLAVVFLGMLLHSVIMPKNVAMRGMELISAQDFNNRLVKTGEHDADKIVKVFNAMIDRLRSERLRKQEHENLMHQIIDTSPMGVMMLDFDRKISVVNPALLRLTGIDNATEIIGQRPDDVQNSLVKEMIGVELGKNEEIRDGDIRTYRCYHLNFIQLGFKREFYLLESLTEEVVKAERSAYEKVIRTISHEVNNTMGGVRTVLGMLAENCDDAEMTEVIESCDTRCCLLGGFVSTYADVVKVPEPVMREIDLNEEAGRLIPFVRMMTAGHIEIEFRPAAFPVKAMADSELLQQALVNIIKNAAESIHGESGKITIAVGIESGNAVIEVANNGEPIPEEVAQNLFRPFFTTKKEGKGIGLTLTSEILTRHHARFRLATDEDGLTRFRIKF